MELHSRAADVIILDPEMLNPNTKLYISSYTNSKNPKIVNMTNSRSKTVAQIAPKTGDFVP
jgi:hypothetical protein